MEMVSIGFIRSAGFLIHLPLTVLSKNSRVYVLSPNSVLSFFDQNKKTPFLVRESGFSKNLPSGLPLDWVQCKKAITIK